MPSPKNFAAPQMQENFGLFISKSLHEAIIASRNSSASRPAFISALQISSKAVVTSLPLRGAVSRTALLTISGVSMSWGLEGSLDGSWFFNIGSGKMSHELA